MSVDASKVLTSDSWPVGTRLQLLNVPWDENYRDVVAWESEAARDAWFASQESASWVSDRFNYLWPNLPVAVPVPYSSAYKYNYVAVRNPVQPVDDEGPQRTYYYFVTDVSYLSPQASNLTVQLDVMTTYCGSMEFGRAFVERGHIAMANSNCTVANRYDYLTIPEGIDVGSEYLPVSREYYDFMGDSDEGAWIVVASTANLVSDPGITAKPNLVTAEGGWFDKFVNGASLYAFPASSLTQFMDELSSKSWVAQCVIDIYVIPGAFVSGASGTVKLFGSGMTMYTTLNTPDMSAGGTEVASFTLSDDDLLYGGAPDKLACYPYSVVEVSTLNGNPLFLKPEYMTPTTAFNCFGTASEPTPKFCVYPVAYQANTFDGGDVVQDVTSMQGVETRVTIPGGSSLDNAVWFENFPHITIVNNNYQLYLASNANRLAYQYQSAGWKLDRANMSAGTAYDNALAQAATSLENANRTASAQLENASRTAGQGIAGSLVGGLESIAASPTALGVGSGVANTLMGFASTLNANENTRNLVSAMQSNQLASIGTSRDIAGNNYDLARRVAQGDYQNRISGIDATVQDAALKAPSVVGQIGGEVMLWANSMIGMCVTVKTVAGASRRAVIDYFERYGYAIHRWLPMGTLRHLLCMSKFAYWKVLESTVTAADANESERHTMRGVLEKGVTLWDAPESIGTTDLSDNQPRDGYSY